MSNDQALLTSRNAMKEMRYKLKNTNNVDINLLSLIQTVLRTHYVDIKVSIFLINA